MTQLVKGTETTCPKCQAPWAGEGVSEEQKKEFGDGFHTRLIGVIDTEVFDGVSAWKCPDCETTFPRKFRERS